MSELKVYVEFEDFVPYPYQDTPAELYDKSEADKVIAELQKQVHDYAQGLYVIQARADKDARHHKYKRCLAMAEWCHEAWANISTPYQKAMWYRKWYEYWLELAEKFKEAK